MPNLKDLDLSSNSLTGSLPSFAASINLRTLRLSNNNQMRLAQASILPPSLSNLHAGALASAVDWPFQSSICAGKFKTFALTGTPVTAQIPECLTNMQTLQQLLLSRCNLVGSLPAKLGNLTSLEVFDVSFNSLSGTVSPRCLHTINNCNS
jgi:Leucine-rich repeat (LRR) protein